MKIIDNIILLLQDIYNNRSLLKLTIEEINKLKDNDKMKSILNKLETNREIRINFEGGGRCFG